MAQDLGQINTYQGTDYQNVDVVPRKRSIADLIDMIDPWDTPFLKYLGIGPNGRGGGSKAAKFRISPWPNTRAEWINDNLAPLTVQTAEAGDSIAGVPAALLVLTGLPANVLRIGDVLATAAGENLLVTAATGTTATLYRVFGGTAGAVIVQNEVLEIIGRARIEGAESDRDFSTNPLESFNFTQIFQAEVIVTRSANKVPNYGMGAAYDYEMKKKFKEQMRLLERTMFYGYKNKGGEALPRAMGGLPEFITTNKTDLAGAALQSSDLEDSVAAAWHAGGNPTLIVCNSWVKRKISSFYTGSVRTVRTEKVGGIKIDYIETEFGVIGTLMTRWCPQNTCYIVEPDYLGILPFDAFFDEKLAKGGDYMKGQIVGEYTAVIKNDPAHAMITGISTTS